MVTIEPFFYQKTTAFKERVQMINKINEIIEKINSGDIGITEEEVREIVTTELSNYYTKEEVDNAIASIDLTPYATITYVDNAIDSIDLTPYATNERVTNEVETLDDKIDTKQDNITVLSPLSFSDNEIGLKGWKEITRAELSNYVTISGNYRILNVELRIRITGQLMINDYIVMPDAYYTNYFVFVSNANYDIKIQSSKVLSISGNYNGTATTYYELTSANDYYILKYQNESTVNPTLKYYVRD